MKLNKVHERLSLKAIHDNRYSELVDGTQETQGSLKKAGKSVNSILPKTSAEKSREDNPFDSAQKLSELKVSPRYAEAKQPAKVEDDVIDDEEEAKAGDINWEGTCDCY